MGVVLKSTSNDPVVAPIVTPPPAATQDSVVPVIPQDMLALPVMLVKLLADADP